MRILVGALVLFATPALADEHVGVTIGGAVGMQQPVGSFWDDKVDAGPAIKLDAGFRITSTFALETSLYAAQGEHQDADDTVTFMHLITLDARFFPFGAGTIEP